MRFELTRAEHIGLAVQRLNHSATSSDMSLSLFDDNISSSFLTFEGGIIKSFLF